jgi:hypothetical protein
LHPADRVLADEAPESVDDRATADTFACDACGELFHGPPAGSGLFLWTRGDELRFEEPPLCEECAMKISIGALIKWESEEEEEG